MDTVTPQGQKQKPRERLGHEGGREREDRMAGEGKERGQGGKETRRRRGKGENYLKTVAQE